MAAGAAHLRCAPPANQRRNREGLHRHEGEVQPGPRSAQGPHRAGKRATIGGSGRQPARSEGAAAATVKLDVILVDTSVWVDHLRASDKALAALLDTAAVLAHPFVIGELALGTLRQREIVLNALSDLPHASAATDLEVLHFIDRHALFGRRIGYVHAHVLAAW